MAYAAVINVPGDQPTIAAAIAAAGPGDEIVLAAGTYNEWGLSLTSGQNLTIRGQGRDQTIIDGGDNGVVFSLNGNASAVENLTIRRGLATVANGGAAVRALTNCNVAFRNVDFRECDGGGQAQGAIGCSGAGSSFSFDSCRFVDNFGASTASAYGGIATGTFVNCLFAGNSGGTRTLAANRPTTLFNCTFINNTDDHGLYGDAVATNCVFDGSNTVDTLANGATASYSLLPGGSGTNLDGVPTFVDPNNDDYSLAPGSLGVDAADYGAYLAAGGGATDLAGSQRTVDTCDADTGAGALTYLDMGAYETFDPRVTNVTQSMGYNTIQEAIDAAGNGDVLELGACTFNEWGLVLNNRNLTIRGQGRDQTSIDGGFHGGVFLLRNDASTFEDLIIREGRASPAGGAGGVQVRSNCDPVFRRVNFYSCRTAQEVPVVAVGCSDNSSTLAFDSCRFLGNFGASVTGTTGTASVAGGSGSWVFTNCLFAFSEGAAATVYFDDQDALLVNCTFAVNTDAYAIVANSAAVTVVNCVIDGANTLGNIAGAVNVSSSLYPGATGDNIDGVPTFTDLLLGDLTLAPGSLGIDAADYDAYIAAGGGSVDLAGAERAYDTCDADTGAGALTYLDMGAFETFAPRVMNVTQGTGHDTIQQALDAAANGDVLELGACTFNEWGFVLDNRDLTIRGQGCERTIIDGGYNGFVFSLSASESTLEDLTIRRGLATINNGGAAVTAAANSHVAFRNVDFRECDGGGKHQGAVGCAGAGSAFGFDACRFVDNFGASTASAYGGIATGAFVNCLFAGNSGAGRTLAANLPTTLVNCTFVNNTDNYSVHGDAVAANCVFDGSNAVTLGNGATASYSLLPGGSGTNVDGVPAFADPNNGDYSLAPGSLGIDAADYDAYNAAGGGAVDLAGNTRTYDDLGTADSGVGALTYLDMGAFETQTDSPAPCPGDLNGDRSVNLTDLGILLSHYGTGTTPEEGDLSGDGIVDLTDLGLLLPAYGVPCP